MARIKHVLTERAVLLPPGACCPLIGRSCSPVFPCLPLSSPQVRKGMARIKHVLTERLAEHEDPAIKLQLRAFIDAM